MFSHPASAAHLFYNKLKETNTMQPKTFTHTLLGCAIAALAVGAQAQDYPNKPVRLIVPFPPGGSVDYVARTISQKF